VKNLKPALSIPLSINSPVVNLDGGLQHVPNENKGAISVLPQQMVKQTILPLMQPYAPQLLFRKNVKKNEKKLPFPLRKVIFKKKSALKNRLISSCFWLMPVGLWLWLKE
jgi:hypothetical protein